LCSDCKKRRYNEYRKAWLKTHKDTYDQQARFRHVARYGTIRRLADHIGESLVANGRVYLVVTPRILLTHEQGNQEPLFVENPDKELMRVLRVRQLSCDEISEAWGVKI
jgi:hypothetical protein